MLRPIEPITIKQIVRFRLIGGHSASLGDFARFAFAKSTEPMTSDF